MDQEMTNKKGEWFQTDRFGMFVHWGLYSITARDMWFYANEQVNQEQYESLFLRFNPEDYDPAKWARLARLAGMRYAVLIAKHHEGFCLWDSKYTDFKVTSTAYKKDIVRMWLDAYRKEGLKVGIYYSLIDWHHPHFTLDALHPQRARFEELNKNRDFSIYVEYLHNQVCELMSEYGKIDIFWPDFSYGPDKEQGLPGKSAADWKSFELKEKIQKLQPEILINDRLGVPGEMSSDFATPEQYIPSEDVTKGNAATPMWEACETIGSSWGYYRGDQTIKTAAVLVQHLVTCVSNNGNLLLNVGPTPRGRIQPEFVDRLTEVGRWLDLNGESVYGAGADNARLLWHGCPEVHPKFTRKGNDLYMHFFAGQYPPFNITVKNIGDQVKYVEFLQDKTDIGYEIVSLNGQRHVRLHMPVIQPDPYDTVIHIALK